MNIAISLACLIAAWGLVIPIVLKMVAMAQYRRKERPKTTVVKCPVDGHKLKDYELFNGHCLHCIHKDDCKNKITGNDNSSSKKVS